MSFGRSFWPRGDAFADVLGYADHDPAERRQSGGEVTVSENTRIGVRYNSGYTQAISPFNFTLTSKQLIAPDQDLMVNRAEIQTGLVKEVSRGKTTALVSGVFAVLVGGILFITLSAEEKKGFGER